ncbi:MAG: alpha/beta hydrolase [Candidatus Bathyarchaeota archaeon]|nr:alpha/beta hydrolase [Candidatus Bathyarchaeota archaeon]
MLREVFYQSENIKLNYVEGPDNGPAFLLLPAFDNRWQSYSSIIPSLAKETHLYALDTRGRGRSDHTPGKYALKCCLEDAIGFIEEVIGEPCHVFGHSLGGWIGLWLAASRPDLVSSLIVGDSSLDVSAFIESEGNIEGREFNKRLMDWAGKPVEELEEIFTIRYPDRPIEYVEMRAMTFSHVDPVVYRDWVDGRLDLFFDGYDSEKILGSVKCPVLVLRAEDGLIGWEEVLWARELNQGLFVKELDGFDHWLGIQDGREQVVIKEIMSFLYSF